MEDDDEEALKILPDAGANVNVVGSDGWTPLMLAVCTWQGCIVFPLIDRGADVNKANLEGRTPLHIAAESGMCWIVEKLISNPGIRVSAKHQSGETAL
ncbi:ankyrin repeat-containing domain protein, partial [Cercophora newfieldiana]